MENLYLVDMYLMKMYNYKYIYTRKSLCIDEIFLDNLPGYKDGVEFTENEFLEDIYHSGYCMDKFGHECSFHNGFICDIKVAVNFKDWYSQFKELRVFTG